MMRPIQRALAAPLGLALVVLLALPMAAFANTSEAIAQTGGMTVVLPFPGTDLSVVVKLDAVGNLTQVDLAPIGTYSATKVGPHAVTFENSGDTSQVKIKAKGDKLAVSASAPTLASFLGTGSWSADLFGTGTATTVAYTVGDSGGAPTIALGAIVPAAGITVVPGTPKMKTGSSGSEASVRIEFSKDGFTKKLDIKVSVKADGERPASLKITLSGKDRQKLNGTLAQLAGLHSWSGHLCNGAPVSFTYTVRDPAGTVAFGTATGATATAKPSNHGFTVRFDGSKTKVKVSLNQKKDLSWELKVRAKTDKCKHTPALDPKVNTPITSGADRDDEHRESDDGSSHS